MVRTSSLLIPHTYFNVDFILYSSHYIGVHPGARAQPALYFILYTLYFALHRCAFRRSCSTSYAALVHSTPSSSSTHPILPESRTPTSSVVTRSTCPILCRPDPGMRSHSHFYSYFQLIKMLPGCCCACGAAACTSEREKGSRPHILLYSSYTFLQSV